MAELTGLIQRRFAGLKNRVHQQKLPEKLQEELKSLGYVAH
ncbi:MAG: hypothetical protein ACJ76N_29155 [Thermoanaerobaculia bacterium]